MNKKIVGVLGLASVALVGGTFAYFTQVSTIDNPFDTAKYSTVVTEDFTPEEGEKWQPGAEVNKDLYVQNTGDRPVVVRVKFEDIWYRGADLLATSELNHLTGEDVFTYKQGDGSDKAKTDGLVLGQNDKSVVVKNFAIGVMGDQATADWTSLQEDGYYYYKKQLEPNASTNKLLDSVKLVPDVDMGFFQTKYYAKIGQKGSNPQLEVPKEYEGNANELMEKAGWIHMLTKDGKESSITAFKLAEYNEKAETTFTLEELKKNNQSVFTSAVVEADPQRLGYSDANYILRITIETVQATDAAVADKFESAPETIVKDWNLEKEASETGTQGEQ